MSNWIEKAAKEIEERVDSCETISTKAAADIIITAYEQSQKEFETAGIEGYPLWLIKQDGTRLRIPEAKAADYLELKAELETANKRIAELEKLLKRVEPMAASGLYREITEVLYVVKGA